MGFERPGWVDERPYQHGAIRSWTQAGGQGILNMATGTGKTITSLLAAAHARRTLDNRLALIVAVPYQHLVEQWASDVRDFGANPIMAFESRKSWQEDFQREILEFNSSARDSLVVITTHKTFASEPFQRELERLSGAEKMLIADEVHHLGAPHLRQGLPQSIPLRLGLSATPERWYDDEGTNALFRYFGDGVAYEYSLQKAIDNGSLCEYYYIPHIVELTADEEEEYLRLSNKIAKLAASLEDGLEDADVQSEPGLKQALFKRARLLGTAEGKLKRLTQLLQHQEHVEHTLVYCGDGSVDDELSGRTKRHVDATVEVLRRDLDVRARRFTARESQDERQELLQRFSDGELEALVAIRCLDEGVDVPSTRTAYILASSSNPRQFVQRRGRILRTAENKPYAVIHDFIVAPPKRVFQDESSEEFPTERSLIEKELRRVNLFAESARNHPDADIDSIPTGESTLQGLKEEYNLRQL
jgi:DNA phosphorothioation system restriction enzyme